MMIKKIIISITLLINFVFSVFGQAPQLKKGGSTKPAQPKVQVAQPPKPKLPANLDRKELFKFERNETIYYGENASNLNFASNKFCCVLQDTITKKMSFIYDGKRMIEGSQVHVVYFDLADYNKCIVLYANTGNNFQYILVDGKTYGPYEDVNMVTMPWAIYNGEKYTIEERYVGSPWLYRNCFVCKIMGEDFLFKNGNLTRITESLQYYSTYSKKYYPDYQKIRSLIEQEGISPNGIHKASVSNKHIWIDDKSYYFDTIPSDYEIWVSNNGDAYVWLSRGKEYFISYQSSEPYHLNETEAFDSKSFKVVKKPQKQFAGFEYKSWSPDKYMITLNDTANKHTFISKLNYPYVLIDYAQYGTGPAFHAEYDVKSNSFVWTTLEDNSFVIYRYHL